jgi:hypothetical protein
MEYTTMKTTIDMLCPVKSIENIGLSTESFVIVRNMLRALPPVPNSFMFLKLQGGKTL